MTLNAEAAEGVVVWAEAAQGDVLDVTCVPMLSGDGTIIMQDTPHGVVLISQTCDLVNEGPDDRLLVAPVVECTVDQWSNVRRGQTPLLVAVGKSERFAADLQQIVSLPRATLSNARTLEKTCDSQSGREAAELGKRIARAFARFAFPDEVVRALNPLRKKVVNAYSKSTNLARVLQAIREFRVACEDWSASERELLVHVIVPSDVLPSSEDRPSGWSFGAATVSGLNPSERPDHLSLERLSELILLNLENGNDAAVVDLWRLWGDKISAEYLGSLGPGVASVELAVVSGADLKYDDYERSEALDFSTLSAMSRH